MLDVTPASPRAAAHNRLPWIVGGVALALVLLATGITVPLALQLQRHAAAEARYAAAADAYDRALADTSDAFAVFEATHDAAVASRAIADAVLAVADPAYVDPVALQALADANGTLVEALDTNAAPGAPSRLGTAPDDTDGLDDRAEEIAAQVAEVRADGEDVAALATAVEAAAAPVDVAGEALMSSLPATAASVDGVFVSAANPARIDYRTIAAGLENAGWHSGSADRVGAYVAAAARLAASHTAEEAQKAGPLYANRRAAEDFARSIAGGVMLDFDWAPIVNVYGANGSYGGTATWNTAHGGYSTMTLSDSVAAMWNSNPDVASLVAHETGHSITSKCITLFQDGFASQAEVFATAWAIGMGYDRNGSGESIYGRPSDELIELSKQCR
jgi:hypothetical protein